jgi:hypothetical protein
MTRTEEAFVRMAGATIRERTAKGLGSIGAKPVDWARDSTSVILK